MPKKIGRRPPGQSLEIEEVEISSIQPHPRNARIHDEANLAAIARSLSAFGQRTPIVVGAEENIIKGCGTWEAAKRLGWARIQVVRAHLSPEQEIAYALADNKTSDLSEFDWGRVKEEILHLQELGVDPQVAGFGEMEVTSLLASEEYRPSDPGEEPESQATAYGVSFRSQDAESVREAVQAAKNSGRLDSDATDAQAIVFICREWLQG